MAAQLTSRLVIEDTTVNAVNNTSGGAVFQFNGSPAPDDYEHIARLLDRCTNGQSPARPPHATPLSPEQPSIEFLARLVPAVGCVIIRNCTVNGTNNTSGGLIVLVNNAPQSAIDVSMPQTDAAFGDANVDELL